MTDGWCVDRIFERLQHAQICPYQNRRRTVGQHFGQQGQRYGTGAPKKGPQSVEMVLEAIAPKLLPVQEDSV
jgi:hypothetical protein